MSWYRHHSPVPPECTTVLIGEYRSHVTVVARRRLAWRGARRSLSFMIGLALLAIAASHGGTSHDGTTGPAARGTTVVSVAVDSRIAARQPASPVAAARTDSRDQQAAAGLPAQPAPAARPALDAGPVPHSVVVLADQATAAAGGPRAPPTRSA
ncbi:MAG: hypothetical protein V7603_5377 [Micromonosporaceae bacterium]